MTIIRPKLSLEIFDGQLLDGLYFSRKVYAFFDQLKGKPDGIEELRLHRTRAAKRLAEELIPIARYVQARYRVGHRIKVQWFGGSQPFDAILWSAGELVRQGMHPRRVYAEVTTSVHPKEYLTRLHLNEKGGSFCATGTTRDKKTRKIISKPHVQDRWEALTELAGQILSRIRDKSAKVNSRNVVLIVNCVPNTIVQPDGWDEVVRSVRKPALDSPFREVFLVDTLTPWTATIW